MRAYKINIFTGKDDSTPQSNDPTTPIADAMRPPNMNQHFMMPRKPLEGGYPRHPSHPPFGVRGGPPHMMQQGEHFRPGLANPDPYANMPGTPRPGILHVVACRCT